MALVNATSPIDDIRIQQLGGSAMTMPAKLWLEYKEECERLREHLLFFRQYADQTHDYWDAGRDSKVGKRLLAMAGMLRSYDAHLAKIQAEIDKWAN